MMYVIFVLLGFFAILLSVWALVKYAFKSEKCPECGEVMQEYFDVKTNSYYKECPNCGYKEVIK